MKYLNQGILNLGPALRVAQFFSEEGIGKCNHNLFATHLDRLAASIQHSLSGWIPLPDRMEHAIPRLLHLLQGQLRLLGGRLTWALSSR
jgi:hypothetical protein